MARTGFYSGSFDPRLVWTNGPPAKGRSFTAANIAQEVKYVTAEGRGSFERPYGLAWLLQLCAELREWDDPLAKKLGSTNRGVTTLPAPLEGFRVDAWGQTAAEWRARSR